MGTKSSVTRGDAKCGDIIRADRANTSTEGVNERAATFSGCDFFLHASKRSVKKEEEARRERKFGA